MERTCLVTGGSGFVGGRLIELLRQDGWRVRAIGRSPEALRRVESLGAVPMRADLEDETALRAALQDCTTVFHAAALFKLWGSEDEFNRANVEGTRRLLTVARSIGVRRFVQIGAAAAVMGEPVSMFGISEDAPLQIRSWAPYSSSKAKSERLVREANVPGSFHTAVIRPPFIWGQGMPMLDQMIRSIETKQFRWPGDGEQAMSTCHVDNVCRAAILAAERGTGGSSYFVSDGADGTLRTVLTALLATRNVVPPKSSAPFGLAWWMARCMEAVWRVFRVGGEPPITRQMLRMIGMPFTLSISRARKELGYQPVVTWQSGIAAMGRARFGVEGPLPTNPMVLFHTPRLWGFAQRVFYRLFVPAGEIGELLVRGPNVSIGSDILEAARAELADYKVPERLQTIAAIPRTTLGKTERKALVEMLVLAPRSHGLGPARQGGIR